MPVDLNALPAHDPRACRALMRGGSKTFFAASLLLPARVRAPASALYAFCRLADDEIDLGTDPHQAMAHLQQRLDDVYEGRPQPIDVDRALASVVHRFAIPRTLLDALLEGFLWDASGRSYDTLEDVQAYGARVAGTVGAMMALVMGARGEAALARACDLGVAMQLTNIARDVGEDARNGRLYLPRQWLAEAGIDAQAWLQAPEFNAAIGSVVQRLLSAADTLYACAEDGMAHLPRDCRPAIHAARLVYAEIGREIERHGLDSVTRRAVVSSQRKAALIARATAAALIAPGNASVVRPTLPAVRFLVDAAARGVITPAPSPRPPAARSFDERAGWVIGLCERQAAHHQRAFR
ncbi:MAG TPA: phytoene/squalene synthase family protein [Rubrivivax sp.]